MWAGTMWALAADQIVMGKHSQLGPIDPQMWTGSRFAPSRAILGQFERAKREIAEDPAALQAWYPILQGRLSVSLLEECDAARTSAGGWLRSGWRTHVLRRWRCCGACSGCR